MAVADENLSCDPTLGDARRTPRELRASLAADKQGLSVRRNSDGHHTYDLVFERNNRPVANDLELDAVEIWLGLRQKS